jgi:hypothetical protein
MMQQYDLKRDIKIELIEYYDKMKSEIDIKGFQLLNDRVCCRTNDQKTNFNEQLEIIELNEKLATKIDSVLDRNLNEINEYFKNDLVTIIDKVSVKKHALKSYLVYFLFDEAMNHLFRKLDKYGFGLLLEFDCYLDENQMSYVK